jgi:dihydrofolate reductase
MRKIVASVNTTLDGRFTGPEGDRDNLEWAMANVEEAAADVVEMFEGVDAILLGRVSYEGFAGYWPTQEGDVADLMNKTPKIVFSDGSIDEVAWGDWGNARLVSGDVEAEVAKLKQEDGNDMVIFASGELVRRFSDAGLIDRYALVVHPTLLGSGEHLFETLVGRRELRLVSVKPYAAGAVQLVYDVSS